MKNQKLLNGFPGKRIDLLLARGRANLAAVFSKGL